jgi:hypothetical protein
MSNRHNNKFVIEFCGSMFLSEKKNKKKKKKKKNLSANLIEKNN